MFNGIEQKGTRLIMAFYSSLKFELNGFHFCLSLSLALSIFPRMFVCGLFWMLLRPILDLVWFQVEFHHLICGKIYTRERFKTLQCFAGLFEMDSDD